MYAIARIAGKQFRIQPDQTVKVPRLDAEEGSAFEIDQILLMSDGEKVQIGQPILKGITAQAKVMSHGRDPKVIVFRKKRRKGFKVTRGHRQGYTLLRVESIGGLAPKPKEKKKPEAEAKPKAAPRPKAKPKAAPKSKTVAKAKTVKPKTVAKAKSPAKKGTKTEKSKGE